MKIVFTLGLLFLLSPFSYGQFAEYFVTVDYTNGNFIAHDSIDGVTSILGGTKNASIDEANGRYIFTAWDKKGIFRIYTVDIYTSKPLFNPVLKIPGNTIIGCQYIGNNTVAALQLRNGVLEFIHVDITSGQYIFIANLNGINGPFRDGPLLNNNLGRYIFVGYSAQGIKIVSVDINSGKIISQPLLSNPYSVNGLTINHTTGKIYCTYEDSATKKKYFALVDPSTGAVTKIKELNNIMLLFYGPTYCTIDEINGIYLCSVFDPNKNHRLLSIDINTGNILYNPRFDAPANPPGNAFTNENVRELVYHNKSKTLCAIGWRKIPACDILPGGLITGDTTICAGQLLTLAADTISCASSVIGYTWDNSLGTGKYKTVNPTITTVYTVIRKNYTYNTDGDTFKIKIIVKPPLKVTVNIDTSICAGQAVRLSAIVQGGNTQTHTIRWTADNSAWADTNKMVTVNPTTTTIYTATLTDGCTINPSIAKTTVTVHPLLKITFSPDTTICVGQAARLRAMVTGGTTFLHKIQWTANTNILADTDEILVVTPTTTTTYEALLKDYCVIPPDSRLITVTLRPRLMVKVNPDTTICAGQIAQLRAIPTGGYASQHSLLWTADSGPWTDTNKTVNISPAITTTYTATLKDNCTTNPDSAKITVTVRPPLQISITAKDSICANQTLLLIATPTGGYVPGHSLLWTANNGPWSSLQNPATDTPKVTSTYTATLSDNCSQPVKTTKTIIVLPTPKADFTIQPATGCPPLPVQLTDKSTGNDTLQNTWKVELAEPKGIAAYTHLFTKPGNYNIGLAVSNTLGCSDNILKKNAITVFDKPTAGFTVKPEIKQILSPILLYNHSQRASSYTWDFDDGNILNQSNKNDTIYTYTDTGLKTIKLVAKNALGCTDTAMQQIRVFDKITCVIPNAFTPGNADELNSVFAPVCTGVAHYTLTIYNRWGQIIQHCENCAWDGTYYNYPVEQGVYMYKLQLIGDSKLKSLTYGMINLIR